MNPAIAGGRAAERVRSTERSGSVERLRLHGDGFRAHDDRPTESARPAPWPRVSFRLGATWKVPNSSEEAVPFSDEDYRMGSKLMSPAGKMGGRTAFGFGKKLNRLVVTMSSKTRTPLT